MDPGGELRWTSTRGILTSTDGGSTWTLRTGGGAFNRLTVSKIAVDPTNAAVAYAAMADMGNNGLWGNTGIWKTIDGGANWTNTTTTFTTSYPWSDVAIDPNNHLIIYAAVGYYGGYSGNGVYKSINGGTTWTLLSGGPTGTASGRIVIAVSLSNSQVVYVTSSSPSTYGLYKMMRSDNGGSTFTDLTAGTPNFLGGQGWYDIVIGVDPSNSAIVYASGVENYSTGGDLVIMSASSGVSWSDISSMGGIEPHTDSHAMAFDSTGRMLLGNDGGIYRYDRAGPSWTNLNGNLQTIQFTGIGLHPTDPNIAIGGSQDNGTELYNGGIIWTETDGGDGGFAKFSQTNGSRAYHQGPYDSFGTDFFRRSDDGGNTWYTYTSGISADADQQNFYAPFVVDPGNGDHVLYGTNRVWETTNGGTTWTNISSVNTAGFNNGSSYVSAIGLAPADLNTIYAATDYAATGYKIFVTTNHGVLWTEHDLGVGGRVNDIQVDPANAQIAYAAISTFNSPNGQVYMTSNGGANWTNISGNLPSGPVWSLQIDPSTSPSSIYAGADDGVYLTTNGGTTWNRFGVGLPNAQVFQIELNNHLHILGAATHGRGMWEIAIAPLATHFTVSAPSSTTAGTAFNFTVTALDASNNVATGYAGTVHFTSTDGAAVLPANSTLSSGSGTFSATLRTAGSRTITATDTVNGSITGTSGTIAVSSGAATHFTVSAPYSTTVGTAFNFTVTALDASNNVATGYAGTVHFTSTDGAAVLPANSTLSSGSGTFSATLKTAGSWTVTATDTVSGSITGTSGTIAVSSGAAAIGPIGRLSDGTFTYYSTFLDVFACVVNGDIIESQAIDYYENLNFNNNASVTVKGGYSPDFSTQTGYTRIHGTMTISAGTLEVSKLILQ